MSRSTCGEYTDKQGCLTRGLFCGWSGPSGRHPEGLCSLRRGGAYPVDRPFKEMSGSNKATLSGLIHDTYPTRTARWEKYRLDQRDGQRKFLIKDIRAWYTQNQAAHPGEKPDQADLNLIVEFNPKSSVEDKLFRLATQMVQDGWRRAFQKGHAFQYLSRNDAFVALKGDHEQVMQKEFTQQTHLTGGNDLKVLTTLYQKLLDLQKDGWINVADAMEVPKVNGKEILPQKTLVLTSNRTGRLFDYFIVGNNVIERLRWSDNKYARTNVLPTSSPKSAKFWCDAKIDYRLKTGWTDFAAVAVAVPAKK